MSDYRIDPKGDKLSQLTMFVDEYSHDSGISIDELVAYCYLDSWEELYVKAVDTPEIVIGFIEELCAERDSESKATESDEKTRDTFIMYRSFADILHSIDDLEDYHELSEAILFYALDHIEVPIKSGVSYNYFRLMKPQFDANYKRFKNGCKPKEKSKP